MSRSFVWLWIPHKQLKRQVTCMHFMRPSSKFAYSSDAADATEAGLAVD